MWDDLVGEGADHDVVWDQLEGVHLGILVIPGYTSHVLVYSSCLGILVTYLV